MANTSGGGPSPADEGTPDAEPDVHEERPPAHPDADSDAAPVDDEPATEAPVGDAAAEEAIDEPVAEVPVAEAVEEPAARPLDEPVAEEPSVEPGDLEPEETQLVEQPPVEQPPVEQPPVGQRDLDPEETQFVDLTAVEPPTTGSPAAQDPTVVVVTDRTLREPDEPDEPDERDDASGPPSEAPYDQPSEDPPHEDLPHEDRPHEDLPHEDLPHEDVPPVQTSAAMPAYVPPVYVPPAAAATTDERVHGAHAAPGSEYQDDAGLDDEVVQPGAELGGAGPAGTGAVPLLDGASGDWRAARRRRRRQTLTFLVALLGVLGLGTVAGLMYTGRVAWPFGGRVDTAAQACTPSAPLPPKLIRVRVYNGSDREGLAKLVAGQLKALGFVVQETGNDPLETKLRTAVEIRYGDATELAGKTTSAYFTGKIRQTVDDRTNNVVDVVLGPKFASVRTRREANRALTAARSTLPLSCPPGVTPPPSPSPTVSVKPGGSPRPSTRARPSKTPKP